LGIFGPNENTGVKITGKISKDKNFKKRILGEKK
jgi:hypothetical protein